MYGKLLVSEMSADITVPMDRSRTGRSAGRREDTARCGRRQGDLELHLLCLSFS